MIKLHYNCEVHPDWWIVHTGPCSNITHLPPLLQCVCVFKTIILKTKQNQKKNRKLYITIICIAMRMKISDMLEGKRNSLTVCVWTK